MITVTLDSGERHSVEKFVTYDYIGAERHFKVPVKTIGEQGYAEHAAYLAWHALVKRKGVLALEFEDFIKVADIASDDDEATGGDDAAPSSEAGQPTA